MADVPFYFFTIYGLIFGTLVYKGIILSKGGIAVSSKNEYEYYKPIFHKFAYFIYFLSLIPVYIYIIPVIFNDPVIFKRNKYLTLFSILIFLIIFLIWSKNTFSSYFLIKKKLKGTDENAYEEIFKKEDKKKFLEDINDYYKYLNYILLIVLILIYFLYIFKVFIIDSFFNVLLIFIFLFVISFLGKFLYNYIFKN